MAYNQITKIWFAESTNPDVTQYEIDVFKDGYILGSPQTISPSLAAGGEIELYLHQINELPGNATGLYSIYVYAVDSLGRSDLPLNLFNLDLLFVTDRLLPVPQDKTGVLLKNATQPLYSSAYPDGDRP